MSNQVKRSIYKTEAESCYLLLAVGEMGGTTY